MDSFTVKISDRSMRRVQIVMAAVQAADQTARAAAEAAQGMVQQARKTLDEALGAICDAHDQTLPEEYSLTIRVNDGEITINDAAPATGTLLYPEAARDISNGTDHSSAPVEAPGGTQP